MSLLERVGSNRTVRLVFLEAFLIVFGVGIAWASTQWQEQRNRERRAEVALGTILDEVAGNRVLVAESIEYHAGIVTQLFGLAPDQTPSRQIFDRGFVAPANVVTASWDLANSTGAISELPYEQLLELATYYADQENYTAQSRELGSLIYERIFNEGSATILADHRNHLEILLSLLYRECQFYDRSDAALGSFGRNPAGVRPESCSTIVGR